MSDSDYPIEKRVENEIERLWRALLEVQRRMADLERMVKEARPTQ